MTRYVEAFSWTGSIQKFLDAVVKERPLLNVCAGRTRWGDVTMDLYEPADVKGGWTELPFEKDQFGAVFADPPWDAGYKKDVALFVREALRVAPVAYLMAPWIYGGQGAKLTHTWVRQMPGVNSAVTLTRYERGIFKAMAAPKHRHDWSDETPDAASCVTCGFTQVFA